MINVYTKNGVKLMMWSVSTTNHAEAIALVKETLPLDHKRAILAVVK